MRQLLLLLKTKKIVLRKMKMGCYVLTKNTHTIIRFNVSCLFVTCSTVTFVCAPSYQIRSQIYTLKESLKSKNFGTPVCQRLRISLKLASSQSCLESGILDLEQTLPTMLIRLRYLPPVLGTKHKEHIVIVKVPRRER